MQEAIVLQLYGKMNTQMKTLNLDEPSFPAAAVKRVPAFWKGVDNEKEIRCT